MVDYLVFSGEFMSQRHYLLNTNIDSSDGETLNNSLATDNGRVVEVAECVSVIPLAWFACFRASDLRACTVQMSSENIEIMVPCVDLATAISNLQDALPLFEEFTGEKKYSREYWQCAIDDLRTLPLPFLTMDIGEILMNSEADELIEKMTSALGRTSEALTVMKQFFLEYNDGVLPYGRAAFYANEGITEKDRIRNTIALDAAICNGFVRTHRPGSAPKAQSPTSAAPTIEQKRTGEQEDSRAKYRSACQYEEAKDYEQAVIWYRKAIGLADASQSKSTDMFENGSAAMCNLADKYEHGLGVPQDFQLALDWYRKSAAKGNCVAQYSLGNMYKKGLGVQPDTVEAFEWFQKSAWQGYASARSQLAELNVAALNENPVEMNGFMAGTLVHTQDGLRPIEELKVGDLVLTWPENKPRPIRPRHPFRLPEEYIYMPVTKMLVHEDQMISHVPILGTGRGDDETLRVTPNHPIWSEDRGWLPASVLKASHSLVNKDFANDSVRRVRHDVERVRVYNIEVAEDHTYFVGKQGIWVHR